MKGGMIGEMTGISHLYAKACTFSASTILESMNIEGSGEVAEATGYLQLAL